MTRPTVYTADDRAELQRISKLALSRSRTQLAQRHPAEARQLYDVEVAALREAAGFPATPRARAADAATADRIDVEAEVAAIRRAAYAGDRSRNPESDVRFLLRLLDGGAG